MRVSVALSLLFIFSPLIVVGRNVATLRNTELADVQDNNDTIKNTQNICLNETLTLNFTSSITISRNSIVSSSLRCLIIKIRGVSIMNGAFDQLPNLKYLDLRGNNISPEELFSYGNLSSVVILSLGNQNYNYRSQLYIKGVYPKLRYLDLRRANINGISSTISNPFPNLTRLDLSENNIDGQYLSPFPDTLTHLDLNGNRISDVSLNRFRNLLYLRLDNNNIRLVDTNYGINLQHLTQLRNLSIGNNDITSLGKAAFSSLQNLRFLNLSNNYLKSASLFRAFDDLNLDILLLDRNLFESIPNINSNLSTLSLNHNQIKYITVDLSDLPYLRNLSLSNNTIEVIDVNAFQQQRLLEELYLDDNQLSYLPKYWCQSMKNLRKVNLSGNKFVSLESVIYSPDLPIEEFYFERNPLAYIKGSILAELLPRNMIIYLNVTVYNELPTTTSTAIPWTSTTPW